MYTYDPSISLPGEMQVYVYAKTYAQIFIEFLFPIPQNWEQPKYSSVSE